jgi:outer membrane protein assembly factor BamB
MNGDKIWSYSTEKSFINSFKKLSIIIKNQFLVFNNSLGDITAINTNDGALLWQLSTQNSQLFEDIMNLKTSEIIENEGSIYFSNNKGQFFSIDLKSGAINWMQNIISDLKPGIVGNLIFTISLDGYFFIIDKQNGNILRIVNIFNQTKINKKRKVYPTGFVFNHKDLYITTSNGRLIITNIKTGKIKNVLKIDNEKISRPFVKNQNMYLIRNNSILKLY